MSHVESAIALERQRAATLDRAREVAIHTHCPAGGYLLEGLIDFVSYNTDLELTRSICHEIGFIDAPDVFIAAFEIDEQIFIVRIESNGQVISVEERGL